MPTPLFPTPGTPIQIAQGGTGNCYFLSSLDCIFNAGEDGFQRIRSLFTEDEHGVTLRIKRSAISAHLKPEQLQGKYTYSYDPQRNEDVFVIDKQRLKTIDECAVGVKSNSLAVKILEHISSYYYVADPAPPQLMDSVLAHNRLRRHSGTSTEFMGQLIGIQTEDLTDFSTIIKLKLLDPNYPVYISMNWGKADAFGNFHGRHGLRVDRVVANPASPGGYDFILVNPWNNQVKEAPISLDELKTRSCRFCLFHTNPREAIFKKLLLNLPIEDAQYILASAPLSKLMLDINKSTPSFMLSGSVEIRKCMLLFRQMPNLPSLFNVSNPIEQQHFTRALSAANGNKDLFFEYLLKNTQRPDLVRSIVRNEVLGSRATLAAVDFCLKTKDTELFNLMQRVNFLALINYSSLDKNTFLSKLLDLETNQPKVNFIRLKAIADYIQTYRRTTLPWIQPLSIVFDEQNIFKLAFSHSITKKLVPFSGDSKAAQKAVEESLIRYYFDDNLEHIAYAEDLKNILVDNKIVNKTIIENLDSLDWVIYGTGEFLKNKTLSDRVKSKISHADFDDLTEEQLKQILELAHIDNPRDLFEAIYALDKINHDLAMVLGALLKDNFKAKFHMEPSVFAEKIRSEVRSEFTNWLFNNILVKEYEEHTQAEHAIAKCVRDIADLPVTFQNISSIDLVERHKASLILNVQTIAIMQVAHYRILARNGASDIEKSIAEKIDQINKAAQVHTQLLKDAEQTVQDNMQQIRTMTFSFEQASSSFAIQALKKTYNSNLNGIALNTQLTNALALLSPTPHKEALHELVVTKTQEMERAAAKQQEQIDLQTRLSTVIETYNELIQKMDINFNGLNSEQEINAKVSDLLNDLQDIRKEAQEAFELVEPNTKITLQDIMDCKISNIRAAADSQKQLLATTQLQSILDKSKFSHHLKIIDAKSTELENMAKKDKKYKSAAKAACTLHASLIQARSHLLDNPGETQHKIELFKDSCAKAISKALPTLQNHRGWKQTFVDIANALLFIITGSMSYFATNRFRVFTVATDSEKKVASLDNTVKSIPLESN